MRAPSVRGDRDAEMGIPYFERCGRRMQCAARGGLPDPGRPRRGGAERGQQRIHLDLALGAIADRCVEHARQREMEPASIAELALGPDLSMVRLHDTLADGETQSGPSLLARRGIGDLIELPEDP